MLQKSHCRRLRAAASGLVSALLFCVATPLFAWSNTTLSPKESGADARPDYNAILAEKIAQSGLAAGSDETRADFLDAALNPIQATMTLRAEPASDGTRYRVDWALPLGASLTTGPVAQYAAAAGPLGCPDCDFSRDGAATLGWRIDSRLGWIAPYAQLGYRYQTADGTHRDGQKSGRAPREQGALDVSIGAHLPFNDRLAAFAAFSQSDAFSNGEPLIYSLGVSASF